MSLKAIQRMQNVVTEVAAYLANNVDGGVFCQEIYTNAKVVSVVTDPTNQKIVEFKLFTSHDLRNNMGLVHGGASSTILALLSQLALGSDDKYWKSDKPTDEEIVAFIKDMGSTRSMDVQIIQAVPLEADIMVKCHVLSNTKSNAFIVASIQSDKGRTLVSGVHDIMKFPPTGREEHSLRSHFDPAKL